MLASLTIGAQIAYPLVSGRTGHGLTVAIVVLFFATSVAACGRRYGGRAAVTLVAIAAGGGLLAEAIGVRTGIPFGEYRYAGTLGPQILGVPLVIPLAWAMMAYPALEVARALTPRAVPLVGGLALASWDLFLDPQMVAAGHWTWVDPDPSLPGVAGIPLTNFAGWLVVAVLLVGLLDRAIPRGDGADPIPGLLYLWTYASSVLANAAFFGRPWVALVGGVGMGSVAIPYARHLLRSRR